jgi:hypothetical protein
MDISSFFPNLVKRKPDKDPGAMLDRKVQKLEVVPRVLFPPTMNDLMSDMEALLKTYDADGKRTQTRDRKQKDLKFRFQFTIGRTVRAKTTEAGNKTWSFPHNFVKGKGVYAENAKTLKDPIKGSKPAAQKEIYRKAAQIVEMLDPVYAANGDWVVQVHAMDSQSKVNRHTDDDDLTYQYGVILGDFEGGELLTWDSKEKPCAPLAVQNKIVKLDGRLYHQVMPVTRGVRYSLYFYKLYDRTMVAHAPIFEPACIVHG